jgi:hypothetical protein
MPTCIHPLIESGILLASIAAVVLNLFFNGAPCGVGTSLGDGNTACISCVGRLWFQDLADVA